MPGSSLLNHLRDLKYRVEAFQQPKELVAAAQSEGPMFVFLDLESEDSLGLIGQLRGGDTTKHIPIIAFGEGGEPQFQAAQSAGATLVVGEAALLTHLPGLLDQALQVD